MYKHGFFGALRINKQGKVHNIMDFNSCNVNGVNEKKM